jgi:hypothetical protein
VEAGMIVCPDCKKPMIRIGAKIEEKWVCLWMCDCKPEKWQIDKWDKTYNEIIEKYGSVKDKLWLTRGTR